MQDELKSLLRRLISKRETKKETLKKAKDKFYHDFKMVNSKSKFIHDLVKFLKKCSTVQSYDAEKIYNFQTEVEQCLINAVSSLQFKLKTPKNSSKNTKSKLLRE